MDDLRASRATGIPPGSRWLPGIILLVLLMGLGIDWVGQAKYRSDVNTSIRRYRSAHNESRDFAVSEMFAARQLANLRRVALCLEIVSLCMIAVLIRRHQRAILAQNEMLASSALELQRLNGVMENVVEGVARLDTQGRYVSVNPAYARMLGYAPEALLGKSWDEMVPPEALQHLHLAYQVMRLSGKAEAEAPALQQDGASFIAQVTLVAMYDESGTFDGHYRFIKDISDKKALEAKLSRQAYHDTLTDLPNRTLFQDRVSQALTRAERSGERIAVLFLDLDNFKYINDSFGYKEGDQLLVTLATRMSACVQRGDTVCRLGGDEFIILVEIAASEQDVIALAERILTSLQEPMSLQEQEVFVTASIGIAFSAPEGSMQTEALLRSAHAAMYEAKTNGKAGYVVFEPRMNDQNLERMELEADLRHVLEKGELQLYYQPIVLLESGEIHGVETLVRWEHPRHGLVSPTKFIPIAEENGMIVPIGAWVLMEACRQAVLWKQARPDRKQIVLSVNLSGYQLRRDDLVDVIAEILQATGMDPAYLKLEITESVMLTDAEATIAKLEALKKLGVQLAIDDFGTGYSSLQYLQSLPVDTVKIDRSFIKIMGDNVQPAAVVLSIIRICHALNMSVTSEGIETNQQVAQLQALGCEYGQGFYFAKPLFGEALETYLRLGRVTVGTPEEMKEWSPEDYIYLVA